MIYTITTPSYNDRRYGRPWLAIVTTSLNKDFKFENWEGRPGDAGMFRVEAEPGTMTAQGQKDVRKGRGGVDYYTILLADGTEAVVTKCAAEYRILTPAQRLERVDAKRAECAADAASAAAVAAVANQELAPMDFCG